MNSFRALLESAQARNGSMLCVGLDPHSADLAAFGDSAEGAYAFCARLIAATVQQVSTGGSSCATFADCMRVADEGRNLDYDGPNGVLALDAIGRTTNAKFEQFRIDPDTGRDVRRSVITVGNS
jgi:hypothetical protein